MRNWPGSTRRIHQNVRPAMRRLNRQGGNAHRVRVIDGDRKYRMAAARKRCSQGVRTLSPGVISNGHRCTGLSLSGELRN